MQYELYRSLRLQFLVLLMMGAVTPETCRVTLRWINICILLQLVGFLLTLTQSQYSRLRENCKRGNIFFVKFNYISVKCSIRMCDELFGPQFNLIFMRSYWTFCLNHVQCLSLVVTKFCLLSICSTAPAIHSLTNIQKQNKFEGSHLI